jgi:hypothetical protein
MDLYELSLIYKIPTKGNLQLKYNYHLLKKIFLNLQPNLIDKEVIHLFIIK